MRSVIRRDPGYKGVVLNEMKGAFSSVDETIIDELNRMLFPDNCYQYVSGGDPEHITDLSYVQVPQDTSEVLSSDQCESMAGWRSGH
jgi:Zn-dependent M16 (insulinase) family peptidase